MSRLAAAGLTTMPDSLPAIRPSTVSVAANDWVPAVSRVALKVWTPWSAAVKV